MFDQSQAELCCVEARKIIERAGEVVELLSQNDACEGHKLMAAQCVVALRRLGQLVEVHRARLASEVHSDAIDPPISLKRRWWFIVLWRSGRERQLLGGHRTIAFRKLPHLLARPQWIGSSRRPDPLNGGP